MTKQGGWPPSGFGARLKAERERAGLTQAQLAEKAGCNKFTVAKTERGEQEPAWPLVLALARALGVEVGAFVPEAPVTEGGAAPEAEGPPSPAEGAPPAHQERTRKGGPPKAAPQSGEGAGEADKRKRKGKGDGANGAKG